MTQKTLDLNPPVASPPRFRAAANLYVHIPFCETKCSYCAFNSVPEALWNQNIVERYLCSLENELRQRSSATPLETVYLGGGTPSVLTPAQLTTLADAIHRHFTLAPVCEWTMEMNPGTVHESVLGTARSVGVNRVSLGAQTFDDERLTAIGRRHRVADIHRAAAAVKETGFKSFNVDLIYGLPTQGLEGFSRDVEAALALNAPHLSLYNLQFEEGTEFHTRQAKGELSEENEDIQIEMYRFCVAALGRRGVRQYEISNFAEDGRECRHNTNYWNNESYIGVGAGAWGCLGGVRYRNALTVDRYVTMTEASGNAIIEADVLSAEDAAVETIISGLRTREGLSRRALRHRFATDIDATWPETLAMLTREGLVLSDGDSLRLSERGFIVSNSIFETFVRTPT